MQDNLTIPLFPLSAHLLPGGRLALRIFEPRYVRMIKQVCAENSGFGICMLNAKGQKENNSHFFPIGTYVKVVDFDLLKDGLLGVTVEASACFKVLDIQTADDGLINAQCSWLENWKNCPDTQSTHELSQQLKEIFDKYPEFQNLYTQPKFDDPVWVIHRWLEMVPVDAEKKQQLLAQKDCINALAFLTQLIE